MERLYAYSLEMALFKRKSKNQEGSKKIEEKPVDEQAVWPASPASRPASPSLPNGGDANSYRVVLSPHITEKGTLMGEQNKYIFRIAENANKTEAKKAVENLYKVKVAKVRILYAQSKFRQVGRHEGYKAGFKKAIVTLRPGNKINLAS